MEEHGELWGPSGLEWLENHLGRTWPDWIEKTVAETWKAQEKWLLNCHPDKALLLLLRQYLLGEKANLEKRLRNLIVTLAKFGNPGQIVAAFSLLGLAIVEERGFDSELEAICIQIQNEPVAIGTYEYVLRHFLFAQAAVLKGELQTTEQLYGELIDGRIPFQPISVWILGRIYEKSAIYILRNLNILEVRWRVAAEQWCKRFADSFIIKRLQKCLQSQSLQSSELHPIVIWRLSFENGNDMDGPIRANREDVFNDQEVQVLLAILESRRMPTIEAIEHARYIARAYGDPFWMERSDELSVVTRQKQITDVVDQASDYEYRFTFFESFQAYSRNGQKLFPLRYKRKKVKQLLALLLLQPHYRMVKEILLNQLFGDDERNQDSNYLHVLIHRLRELLYRQTGIQEGWIWIQDGLVFFNEDRVNGVDVQEFLKRASVGHQLWLDDQEDAVVLYRQATQMFRDVIAPEFEYDDWVASLRAEVLNNQQKMLGRLIKHANQNNLHEQVIHYCEELLKLNEWDLSTVYQLCQGLENTGDTWQIIQTCNRYERLLRQEHEEIPEWLKAYQKKYCVSYDQK
ncbi:bacterial transcriptional activator domain-containing protein [Aneurinibacillus terranovensis]|uniref:bacterial transcriptional activator domain-containing protein n=1 Tax=Aneurinibacillus terranovensis TaxID=278991 RepID=UPI00041997A0|nr:bacterial transcriptional activator domain-containing protein [Aneurinibacillus terranovensis]